MFLTSSEKTVLEMERERKESNLTNIESGPVVFSFYYVAQLGHKHVNVHLLLHSKVYKTT